MVNVRAPGGFQPGTTPSRASRANPARSSRTRRRSPVPVSDADEDEVDELESSAPEDGEGSDFPNEQDEDDDDDEIHSSVQEDAADEAETTTRRQRKTTGKQPVKPRPASRAQAANSAPNPPSVETLLDRRASAASHARPTQSSEFTTSPAASTASAISGPSTGGRMSKHRPPPRADFFAGKTFLILGRRPVEADAMAEVTDVRDSIKAHGGTFVKKLADEPDYLVQVGILSNNQEQVLESMERTEVLNLAAFKRLFVKGLTRLLHARGQLGVTPTSRRAEQGIVEVGASAEEGEGETEEGYEESDAAKEPPASEPARTDSDDVLFKDKTGLILVFEIPDEFPPSRKAYLERMITDLGGKISTRLDDVDIRLIDVSTPSGLAVQHLERTTDTAWRSRPWHWVPACAVARRLVKMVQMESLEASFVWKGGEQIRFWVVPELGEEGEELRGLLTANGGLDDQENAELIVLSRTAAATDPRMAKRVRAFENNDSVMLVEPAWVRETVKKGTRCQLPKRMGKVPSPPPRPSPRAPPSVAAPAPPFAGLEHASNRSASPVGQRGGKKPPGRRPGAGRQEFTDEEDHLMIQYMAARIYHEERYGAQSKSGQKAGATGMRMYDDMCDEDVRPWTAAHSAQSWRNRFMKNQHLQRALELRRKKLEQGRECSVLNGMLGTHRAPKENAEADNGQSEEIESAGEGSRAESLTPSSRNKRVRRFSGALTTGPNKLNGDVLASFAASTPQHLQAESVVLPEQQPIELADIVPAADDNGRSRRSPTIPIEELPVDGGGEEQGGAMEYQPEPTRRETSIPLAATVAEPELAPERPAQHPSAGHPSPARHPPSSGGIHPSRVDEPPSTPAVRASSVVGTVLSSSTPVNGDAAVDDDAAEDDDDPDESGQATQFMRTTLAALHGDAKAYEMDVDSDNELEAPAQTVEVFNTNEDEDVVPETPQVRLSPAPEARSSSSAQQPLATSVLPAADQGAVDRGAGSSESDEEGIDEEEGGATLAMQVVLQHAANRAPSVSDTSTDNEDDEDGSQRLRSQSVDAPTVRTKTRSALPPPPARSSRESSLVSKRAELSAPPVAPIEAAIATPRPIQASQPVGISPTPTNKKRPLVEREQRRLSRPVPRKSLDLPGIGNVPHYDFGGPPKKPRLSARARADSTASAHTTASAAPSLNPKERVKAWATSMEAKYTVDRRKCSLFLQKVYPNFGAAERALFAALPLSVAHAWTAEEDEALERMEGALFDTLEANLGERVLFERLRLVKRHKRNLPPP